MQYHQHSGICIVDGIALQHFNMIVKSMNTTNLRINKEKQQLIISMPIKIYSILWIKYRLPYLVVFLICLLSIYYIFLSSYIPWDPDVPPYEIAFLILYIVFAKDRPNLVFDKRGVKYINGSLDCINTGERTKINPFISYKDIKEWYIGKRRNQYYLDIINMSDLRIQFVLFGTDDEIGKIKKEIVEWIERYNR